jgi:hypothetical protein
MSNFIDVTPDKWFYIDVAEVTKLTVDNVPFFSSIKYNQFVPGEEALDMYFVAEASGMTNFYLPKIVAPSLQNFLTVTVNNILANIDLIEPIPANNQTLVRLTRGVHMGSQVRFFHSGTPLFVLFATSTNTIIVDAPGGNIVRTLAFGEQVPYIETVNNFYRTTDGYIISDQRVKLSVAPIATGAVYPSIDIAAFLDPGYLYLYDPFEGYSTEIVRMSGKQLRRVNSTSDFVTGEEYTMDGTVLKVPYDLNNVLLDATFLEKNDFGMIKTAYVSGLRPSSESVLYNNKFFPDLRTTRAEFLTILDKMILSIFEGSTDDFQNYRRAVGISRFSDVNTAAWYWQFIRDIEGLVDSKGKYILAGFPDGTLRPDQPLTRAEMATIIDKVIDWLIEALR